MTYRPAHEDPGWDSFDSDAHRMRRVGPSTWVCERCGGRTEYRHCISPLPDDWGVRSGLDGRSLDDEEDCDEEAARSVLVS